MLSPEKFKEILDIYPVHQDMIDEMNDGYPKLSSKSNKKAQRCVFQAGA